MHACYADGCRLLCIPTMIMCARHWQMVPSEIRLLVWGAYKPGKTLDPKIVHAAIAAVAKKEGLRA